MFITAEKTEKLQILIKNIYSEDMTQDFLSGQMKLICEIMDSQYFATIIFPNSYSDNNVYLSNNPDEFNNIYSVLQDQDLLMKALVEENRTVLYREIRHRQNHEKLEFFVELNKVRPVSDCCYIPIHHNGRVQGFTAVARGDLKNRVFDDNDLGVFKFISSFLNEGFIRAINMPAPEGNMAFLDGQGRILKAGDGCKDILMALFGDEFWNNPMKGKNHHSVTFKKGFERFISPIFQPGSGMIPYSLNQKSYRLEFRNIREPNFRFIHSDEAQYEIRVKENTLVGRSIVDLKAAAERYHFTPRELQVIDCIYRGLSNLDISNELKISPATVKTHIWNIYNKAGVDSRTGLIFLLS